MPRAPSASAIARPTRRPAPVTSATRPASDVTGLVMVLASGGGCAAERCQQRILPGQPFGWHLHHADRARALGRAVPVGAAAHHEPELLAEAAQPRRVGRGVARMLDLDAVEPERAQR